jgi:hypothetical protein
VLFHAGQGNISGRIINFVRTRFLESHWEKKMWRLFRGVLLLIGALLGISLSDVYSAAKPKTIPQSAALVNN